MVRIVSELTQLLLASGIDPLKYIDYIPDCYLCDSEDIINFKIPNNITSIGDWAFIGCTSLTSITIPNQVNYIGNSVFLYCTSLKEIIIGNGIDTIPQYAFGYCTALEDISIPDNVKYLQHGVFGRCTSLKNLTLGANISYIGKNFIRNTAIKSIDYNNTMENWREINIDAATYNDNAKLFACIIHCTNGNLKYDKKLKEWNLIN